MSKRRRADLNRAHCLCLLVGVRYGLADDSLRYALMAAHERPKRALACYEAIWRSIPQDKR